MKRFENDLQEYKPDYKENFNPSGSSGRKKDKMSDQLSLEDERRTKLQEIATSLLNGEGGTEHLDAALAEILAEKNGVPDQDKIVKHELEIIEQVWQEYPELKNRGVLDLYGVTKIDDDAAQILGKYQGVVKLNSLKQISDGFALAFSEQPGFLYLEHLENFSSKAVNLLAKRKFRVFGSEALNQAIDQAKNQGELF